MLGGGMREEGDAKCDFSFEPIGTTVQEKILQLESNSMTTVLSKNEIVLHSGEFGFQYELNNMGSFTLIITEINDRVVTLTCFGDQSFIYEIGSTISAID